jgi:DinB superfamily
MDAEPGAGGDADDWARALERLQLAAPDVVAAWRALDETREGLIAARRVLRNRVAHGAAAAILVQEEAVADELEGILRALPRPALRAPGGEADWNVSQAFFHTTAARRFLAAWAALAAAGSWPSADPPVVTPSIPGPADVSRDDLLVLLDKSRRSMARSAATIAGHELERCPLDHPLVGHLRCGEWLLFTGVHDLMHLEQLHRIAREYRAGG